MRSLTKAAALPATSMGLAPAPKWVARFVASDTLAPFWSAIPIIALCLCSGVKFGSRSRACCTITLFVAICCDLAIAVGSPNCISFESTMSRGFAGDCAFCRAGVRADGTGAPPTGACVGGLPVKSTAPIPVERGAAFPARNALFMSLWSR